MAHKHPVYDTDKHFVIDPVSKRITTECSKVTLPQHSHRSERFTFEIDKEVEGHDMSLCNLVEIHFQNIDSENKENKNIGIYKVDDLKAEGDTVFCSWQIEGESTYYSGALLFAIHFSCVSDTGEVEYNLPTLTYSAIQIGKTVWNSETIAKQYPGILEQFEARLSYVEKCVANPIAYLYNGVQYPTLPEWDKEVYPYAYISKANQLNVLSGVTFGMNDGYPSLKIAPVNHPFYYGGTDEWNGPYTANDITGEWVRCSAIAWANFDVIDASDNSTILAASEPVPVYE